MCETPERAIRSSCFANDAEAFPRAVPAFLARIVNTEGPRPQAADQGRRERPGARGRRCLPVNLELLEHLIELLLSDSTIRGGIFNAGEENPHHHPGANPVFQMS